jgi:hypothetical protein
MTVQTPLREVRSTPQSRPLPDRIELALECHKGSKEPLLFDDLVGEGE